MAIIGLKPNNNPTNQSERRPSRSTYIVFPCFPLTGKKEKQVFQTCFLPKFILLAFFLFTTDGNLIKRSGEKAMSLCLGLNFGPITWAIIDPR